ncbi:FCD domain-containing protein [Pseudomonas sp. S1_G07]
MLARFTTNEALYDTYRRLVVQLKLFRSYSLRHTPQSIHISLGEHQAIFKAIVDSGAVLAGARLRQHSIDSLERLHASVAR